MLVAAAALSACLPILLRAKLGCFRSSQLTLSTLSRLLLCPMCSGGSTAGHVQLTSGPDARTRGGTCAPQPARPAGRCASTWLLALGDPGRRCCWETALAAAALAPLFALLCHRHPPLPVRQSYPTAPTTSTHKLPGMRNHRAGHVEDANLASYSFDEQYNAFHR